MFFRLSTTLARATGPLEIAFQSAGKSKVNSKFALRLGWSKQGKAVLARSGTKRV